MYDYYNHKRLIPSEDPPDCHSFYYMLGADPGQVFIGIANEYQHIAILSQEMIDDLALYETRFALIRGTSNGFIDPEIIPKLQEILASGREIWIKWT